MKQTFLVHNDIIYTYENLLDDLNNKEIYSTYIYVQDNNPYEIFLSIIHSLLYDYPIEILDGDFSEKEINELGLNVGNVLMTSKITESSHFLHFDEVIQQIQAIEEWHLTLYTSGTTGRPKK